MPKQDIHLRLGNRIRKLRTAKNLTQEKLAQKSGVSLLALQLLEARKPSRSPTLRTLKKLAEGLDIEVSELLEFEE